MNFRQRTHAHRAERWMECSQRSLTCITMTIHILILFRFGCTQNELTNVQKHLTRPQTGDWSH